jgi:siroheme decarboxylase
MTMDAAAFVPDDADRRLIKATQAGLPLCRQPYHALAEALGLEAADVQARMRRMLAAGVIRA